MFEIEMQVHAHHQQLASEAAQHALAKLAVSPRRKLERSLRQLVLHGLHVWNARFHTEAVRAVEACCAIVAPPETECVECAPAV